MLKKRPWQPSQDSKSNRPARGPNLCHSEPSQRWCGPLIPSTPSLQTFPRKCKRSAHATQIEGKLMQAFAPVHLVLSASQLLALRCTVHAVTSCTGCKGTRPLLPPNNPTDLRTHSAPLHYRILIHRAARHNLFLGRFSSPTLCAVVIPLSMFQSIVLSSHLIRRHFLKFRYIGKQHIGSR